MMSKNILIADDDNNVLELIDYLLTEEGFNVYTSHPEVNIFEQVEEIDPDLIIMDVNYQKSEGQKICKEIRQKHGIQVVLMSADLRYSNEIIADSCANGLIAKPFNIDELLTVANLSEKKI